MHKLRESITKEDVTGKESTPAELHVHESEERFFDDVLQAKSLEDGRNLLMHAASRGRGGWFRCLVSMLRNRVRRVFISVKKVSR